MRTKPHAANGSCRGGAPRVAYIMSRFPKLTETFILYEILAMEARGTPVAVYPLLREKAEVRHPEVDRVMMRVRFFPFVSWPIVAANARFLLERPLAYGRTIAEALWHTRKSRNFFVGALGIIPKVVRFAYEMERAGIEHVHAHFATHPALAAFIIHRLTGIPYSFTAHGSDLHVDRTMLPRKVDSAAFVVTVSEFNKNVIVEECGEPSRGKVRVVHCGVDPEVFAPRRTDASRAASDGGEKPLQILCVGSFEEVKGHRFLLEACARLKETGVPFECHFVGEGPLRPEVEKQISSSGLAELVRVHGGLPRGEVLRLLGQAEVMVLPSVPTRDGKREGIPVALMEGMACGLPVVSSRLSGIPELVEDGVSGLLVEPRDSLRLAEALASLARDPNLRAKMGRAGREKVLSEFDLRANAEKLTALFFPKAEGQKAMLSSAGMAN